MARISKENVKSIVEHLLTKRTEEVKLAEKLVKEYVEKLVIEKTNPTILEAFKNFPNYFQTTHLVQVSGFGFNYETFYTLNNCIKNLRGSSYIQLVIEDELVAKKLGELQNKVDILKNNKEVIKGELLTLIFSLGTYKKVIETIPDSKVFIEKLDPSKFTPMVNKSVTSILNKLK